MQDHTIETLHMQVTHPALPMTHLMILRLAGYMFSEMVSLNCWFSVVARSLACNSSTFGDGLSKIWAFGIGWVARLNVLVGRWCA
jgi:hypothetical protein